MIITPRTLPDYRTTSVDVIELATAEALSVGDRLIEAALAAPSSHDLIDGLDAAERAVADATTPWVAMVVIHPDPAIRAAAAAAEERVNQWRVAVASRSDVADIVMRYAATASEDGSSAEYVNALRRWHGEVRLAGAGLSDSDRAELHAILSRLAGLASRFDEHVTDANIRLPLTVEELAGAPAAFLASLDRLDDGRYDLLVDNSTAIVLLETVLDRTVRERVDRAFLSRGLPANRTVIREAALLRRRAANLLGYATWLDLRAEWLVAGSRNAIETFVDRMERGLRLVAAAEYEAMAHELATLTGEPTLVQDWDWRFLDARQRARIGIDQDELREYLDLDDVLAGLFRITEEVFGVRVTTTTVDDLWHPDVRRLELVDVESRQALAVCLLDPYAREGKAPNAFMWTLVAPRAVDGEREPAVMALVTSVPRPVDGRPPLLGADDVDAIFHEFGHVLDFALARERILPRPSWAPRDWTEAPSQFLGRWALHADVVRGYARHNDTREAIPDAAARALQQSLDLNSGIRALRLLSMAKLDIAFHTLAEGDEIDVDGIDREAFEARGVPAIPGTMFAAAFAHPWSGYDGACYGFLWSQVLLSEIWERFDRDGATSPVVGASYRREILELGWADDPVAGLTRFLGRPPGEEAFLRRLALPSSSRDA